MTEYDYSPDAYQRYITKQNAVGRWVDHTDQHVPANPFLVSESGSAYQDSTSYSDDYDYSPHRHPDGNRDRRQYDHYYYHQSSHSSSRNHSCSSGTPRSNALTPSYTSFQGDGLPYRYHSGFNQQQYPYNYGFPPNKSGPSSQPRSSYGQTNNALVPVTSGTGGYTVVLMQNIQYQVVQYLSPQPSQTSQPWYKRVFSTTESTTSGQRKLVKQSRKGGGKRNGK